MGAELALLDAEGVTVGSLSVRSRSAERDGVLLTGRVLIGAAPTSPTYRSLRDAPQSVRVRQGGSVAAVIAADAPDVEHVTAQLPDTGSPVLLLACAGGVRPDDAQHHRRVRHWQQLRQRLRASGVPAELVLTPLWADADRGEREAAARAYGATAVLDDLPVAPSCDRRRGATIFFTGLSGSGKSTIAASVVALLTEDAERTVTLLDGDVVRTRLSSELSFSAAHRNLNIMRIGWVAAEITKHGGLAVCAPIAPYEATRAAVRAMVEGQGGTGAFVLVHVATPLAECERRDRKGLYAKARAGLIPFFTGISDPYEEPADAELVIDTTTVSVAEAAALVVDHLRRHALLDGC